MKLSLMRIDRCKTPIILVGQTDKSVSYFCIFMGKMDFLVNDRAFADKHFSPVRGDAHQQLAAWVDDDQLEKTTQTYDQLQNMKLLDTPKEAPVPTKKVKELPLATAKIVKVAKGQEPALMTAAKKIGKLEVITVKDKPDMVVNTLAQLAGEPVTIVEAPKAQPKKRASKAKVEAPAPEVVPVKKSALPKDLPMPEPVAPVVVAPAKKATKKPAKVVDPPKTKWHKAEPKAAPKPAPKAKAAPKPAPKAAAPSGTGTSGCPAAVLKVISRTTKATHTALSLQDRVGEEFTYTQIRQALFQLEKAGKIRKVARGEFASV